MILTPRDWQAIAQREASDLLGTPEGAAKIAEAKRYGALADEIERIRAALKELRDRIKDHPAYADLTEAEELDTGGDTAELSCMARVADAALTPNVG